MAPKMCHGDVKPGLCPYNYEVIKILFSRLHSNCEPYLPSIIFSFFSTLDGNKQSILHCSARAGNVKLINLISKRCQASDEGSSEYLKFCNWTDHWYRTPLHWAILNRHFEALIALVRNGCSMSPPLPRAGKKNKRTSSLIESPVELAECLHRSIGYNLSWKMFQFCKDQIYTSLSRYS